MWTTHTLRHNSVDFWLTSETTSQHIRLPTGNECCTAVIPKQRLTVLLMESSLNVAAAIVDDSEVFWRCVRPVYSKFKLFEADFRLFQQCTLTSFYVYESESSSSWLRTHPGAFPKSFPYYRVKFCCVHKRRRQRSTNRQVSTL